MAGWNLKSGSITQYVVSEDRIWSLFNYVFSDACKKRNTYKFGLIKALLDSVFSGKITEQGVYYSYEKLFERFTYNYWNLVVKYNLRQMRKDGKSEFSKIETILKEALNQNSIVSNLEFESLDVELKQKIIKKVTFECKRFVVGALYDDFDGIIYSFDLKENGVIINPCVYEFMQKYKAELEKINYYSWAKFLEQINDDNVLVRLIDKLELATPRRENLSIYREILRVEFEENTCFYCGKKLGRNIHVDHFIPWSFVKDDKIWNFVLSCPQCNERKNNKLPKQDFLIKIENRNNKIQIIDNFIIQKDFEGYSQDLLDRMWKYAKLSGLKEYS
jgi:hypothetical protein